VVIDIKKLAKRVVCGKKWPKWSGQNWLCGVLKGAVFEHIGGEPVHQRNENMK